MSESQGRTERQPNESGNKLILGWLAKLGNHFGVELSEEQMQIFFHALRDCTKLQINTAFGRCLNECQFMPKLADVHQRMPEKDFGESYVSAKTREMIESINRIVPNPQTWETEERPGVKYRWYGDPAGAKFLLKALREPWA